MCAPWLSSPAKLLSWAGLRLARAAARPALLAGSACCGCALAGGRLCMAAGCDMMSGGLAEGSEFAGAADASGFARALLMGICCAGAAWAAEGRGRDRANDA